MPAQPLLVILGGLPGTGKTTLARQLAMRIGAVHVRIDTIENALRAFGLADVADLGYRVAYAIAEDNLRLGRTVIADSVNPLPVTRNAWRAVAERAGVKAVEVEIICSASEEHQHRVEQRMHQPPVSWQDVITREYLPWSGADVVIDTSGETPRQSVERLAPMIGFSSGSGS